MFECLCCSPTSALGVHFEADIERRKLSLPHRVHFLDRSLSEPEYVHSVEVELRGQKHPDCKTVTFVVQVEHSFIHACMHSVMSEHKWSQKMHLRCMLTVGEMGRNSSVLISLGKHSGQAAARLSGYHTHYTEKQTSPAHGT